MIGVLCAALLLAPPTTADVPVIGPELAFVYAGQEVIIEGQISEIGESKDGKPVPTIAHAPVAFRIYSRVEQRKQRPAKSRE